MSPSANYPTSRGALALPQTRRSSPNIPAAVAGVTALAPREQLRDADDTAQAARWTDEGAAAGPVAR